MIPGSSNAQSAAAAAGPGASTSTSTQTGQLPVISEEQQRLNETENNNVYYPCDDGSDCEEGDQGGESDDNYYDDSQPPVPPSAPSLPEVEEVNLPLNNDAIVIDSESGRPQLDATKVSDGTFENFYDYGEYPTFENCTSLEDCLGVQTNYAYESGDRLGPGDNIVSPPKYTPQGQKINQALDKATMAVATAKPDQLDTLIISLTSLVNLLNTTKTQGNSDKKVFRIPPGFGSGQMGNIPLPALPEDSFSPDNSFLGQNVAHVGTRGDGFAEALFNLRDPLPLPPVNNSAPQEGTTIPPFLIPLGPNNEPLLNPDGTPTKNFVNSNIPNGQHVQDMFPFLDPSVINSFYTTTPSPVNDTYVDNRDFVTRMMNMVRELPMDTRRRMLAGMMFTVPMAAATLAAVGVPSLMIAPLATVIPGFMMAAFTETDPDTVAALREGAPPHRGLSALVDAVHAFQNRNGSSHGHGHGHGGHGHNHGHGHGRSLN